MGENIADTFLRTISKKTPAGLSLKETVLNLKCLHIWPVEGNEG